MDDSHRRTILEIGLLNFEVFPGLSLFATRSSTDLTSPSLSGKVWVTLAMGQEFRGKLSSFKITMSSTSKFLSLVVHFCLHCS